MSLVPWGKLQIGTLAAVIQDLGLKPYTTRTARKHELVRLLQSIELEGLSPVLLRLQEERSSSQTSDHEREESPELEYLGAPPSGSSAPAPVRPVVEIPVHSSPRSPLQHRAGPSRARTRARTEPSPSPSPSPIPGPSGIGPLKSRKRQRGAHVEPRAKGQRRPSVDLSNVPPPSYAILYQERQNISLPRQEPWPLLNPYETFDGVVIPARQKKRARVEVERRQGDSEGTPELDDRPMIVGVWDEEGSVSEAGVARAERSTGDGASTTASVTGRMEAIVVTSAKASKAASSRRRQVVLSDDERGVEM
ncbi:hypothetical protein BD309DRAFT_1020960 [Dichomitus squalens]|uniref:Uncharacterized protein n=1 Tax=Dichomitus squalens (strain LYAD-421) TaxID=732165 RepID=R7T2N5_DICSQ|nr:uncharacterized protein DICSQDRAFT_180482 [Dichomitus squalens LYAD-421 SS1]EJF61767.1 hypothetical protein DICSQDRAFT_180482 [Dichomitus squalens LYAD-421 SS1]TBU41087.1 hypothetical protein BD309DRAFT_1020960 [Dichomitus squalens]